MSSPPPPPSSSSSSSSAPPQQQPRSSGRRDEAQSGQRARSDHNVRLSKGLSYLLRHGASKEGVTLRPDGFARLDAVLSLPRFRQYSLEDIKQVVAHNDKQRFTLRQDSDIAAEDLTGWWIRANQGHSLVVEALELVPITEASELVTLVHGTYRQHWRSIERQGLRRMNRNHIHLATGLPGEGGVISGMRASSQVYIYVDAAKAMADGIVFLRSANNVILTTGKDDAGVLPACYFSRVVDRDGTVLLDRA
ncbi:KptA family-domain-containing protein [Thamnocephalis sphaerospora]|uniref:2'-phosphotransferase n=1 Tax=Thamnocephalis sphaerospora TaxID=78915 RepID=A0A4P9XWZ5_9FUNG|nr:KptA family-domain-containing protein [Thamnocephalis sphaerospora]|eukprot:RKP10953.1 KptA family-domain-containing protein [Thamnocephalis sphaerospora]